MALLLVGAGTAQAQTTTFAYTGGTQTYSVPAGVTAVQVVATGASGGTYTGYNTYAPGARVQATVPVTPGEVLTVVVGGQGGSGGSSSGLAAGGYNGGGAGKDAGAGGGATELRRGSPGTGDYLTGRNALVVAGGGGGSSYPSRPSLTGGEGGSGGTPAGGDGTLSYPAYIGANGGGATQAGPGSGGGYNGTGSPGNNAVGGAGSQGTMGAGGGGGYYGGGGSGYAAGSGGGSSWVLPTGSRDLSYGVAPAAGNGALTITPAPTVFAYTGGPQTYLVPAGVTAVRVVATGASGGTSGLNQDTYGAQVQATVLVTPGEVLTVLVGGRGSSGTRGPITGGYNGGGDGMLAGAGGGATDVRRSGASTGDYLSARNALLVAGGAGGSDVFRTQSTTVIAFGGNGGTPAGGDGTPANAGLAGSVGQGATQAGPGSGGSIASYNANPGSSNVGGAGDATYGCGGGSGYYGGGGSTPGAGGGGGSSWVMPLNSATISYGLAPAVGDGQLTILPVTLPDLTVSTTTAIPAGLYNSLIVTSAGNGTLAGNVGVAAVATVNGSGVLSDGGYVLSGPASFTLAIGGILGISSPQGISSGSAATGSIQVTGTRFFSSSGRYTYQGRTGAQVTGTGLPGSVRALALSNPAGLTLTSSVTATGSVTLNASVLTTAANTLTLGPLASLSETSTGYVTGTVQATRDLSTAGTTEGFGGLGLTLTPGGPTLPGSTLVVRTTGLARPGAGTSRSVRRSFDIQPTVNAGLSVALALTVRDDELNGIAPAGLRLFKSEDAGSTWQPQWAATFASTAATSNQPATYTASLGGVSSFSRWTLGDAANPLPVQLVQFEARAGSGRVALSWQTASEQHSQRFEVERSAEGSRFEQLGAVAAAGNSATPRAYTFADPHPLPGRGYYRLRQVDQDGTATYSPVRVVQAEAASLALFPNPAPGGAATLTGAAPGTPVQVLDALGRVVATATADEAGTAQLVLPAGLAPGVYVVRGAGQVLRLVLE